MLIADQASGIKVNRIKCEYDYIFAFDLKLFEQNLMFYLRKYVLVFVAYNVT